MRFICSAHGFFVSRDYDKEDMVHYFTFSESIQDAHHFGSKKQALAMLAKMEEAGFYGFYYNPTSQTAYKNLYSVRVSDGPFWGNEKLPLKGVSYIQEMSMINYSDKDFIAGNTHPLKLYHSKEVAQAMADEANSKLIENLKKELYEYR